MKIWVLAVGAWLLAGASVQAQVKDLAGLFPARTKVYLEVNQVGQLAKEVRTLVKGTCLEDIPRSLEKFKSGLPDNYYFGERWLDTFGLFLSQEGLGEVGRLGGGAVGFLDVAVDPLAGKGPEVAGILLAGESNLPGLYMRAFLTLAQTRKLAEVEGIGLYRERRFFDLKDRAVPDEAGTTFAFTKGAIIIGSSTKAVKEVVRRLQGKDSENTLAKVADFQKAAALRHQPGLFAYADTASLIQLLAMMPVGGRPKKEFKKFKFEKKIEDKKFELEKKQVGFQKEGEAGGERKVAFQELVDSAKAFRSLAAQLVLRDGSLEINGAVQLDPGKQTAWHDFFSARTVNLDLLHHVPRGSRLALFLALPEGTDFWDKLGKMAPTFETELSLLLGRNVLKMAQLGLVPWPGNRGTSNTLNLPEPSRPAWIVEATDAEAAKALAGALTKVFGPQSATRGRMVVLGADKVLLGEMLAAGSTRKGLLEDPKVAQALKAHKKAHALLVWSLGDTLLGAVREEGERLKDFRGDFKDKGGVPDPDFDKKQKESLKALQKTMVDLAGALEPVPPFVFSLSRDADRLVLTGRQTRLSLALPRLIDSAMEWNYRSMSYRNRSWQLTMPKEEIKKESK